MNGWQVNRNTPSVTLHPWSAINASITAVQLEKRKKDYSEEALKEQTANKIDEIDADVHLFTDGSTSGKQENGGAGIAIMDRYGNSLQEESHPAGKYCASYDGECVAMIKSLNWIKDEHENNKSNLTASKDELKYAIFTDSESLTNDQTNGKTNMSGCT